MATIDIKRTHSFSIAAAKSKAEEFAKILTPFGLAYKWAGNTCKFNADTGMAKGASGELVVTAKDVRIQINLPFLLSMMKKTVEDKINQELTNIGMGK
jgi:putative polyhydroxyalkanoate system protein